MLRPLLVLILLVATGAIVGGGTRRGAVWGALVGFAVAITLIVLIGIVRGP